MTLCWELWYLCYCTWVELGFSFGFNLCSPVPVKQSSVYIGVHGLVAYTVIHCVCHKLFVYDEFKFKLWRTTQITEANIIFKIHVLFYIAKIFLFQFYCVWKYFCRLFRCWIQTGMQLKTKYECEWYVVRWTVNMKCDVIEFVSKLYSE